MVGWGDDDDGDVLRVNVTGLCLLYGIMLLFIVWHYDSVH